MALKADETLTEAELLDLQPCMHYYMIPRYVRLVTTELPKTPAGKFQKSALRAAGTADCWDREALGYKIRR